VRTLIVPRAELPETAFALMHAGFPNDRIDQRAFWSGDGSFHALVFEGDRLVAHAGVVDRTLHVGGRPLTAAYVEYVCAEPRGRGYGTAAMRALADEIARRGYSLAALATTSQPFYERLGWRSWRGPTAYRAKDGSIVPTPDERPMVLDLSAGVDVDGAIECESRAVGDVW
jgi:aminoglycoside 2'-N-acetyltransferase I